MGTSPISRGSATRARILAAATEVMVSRGLANSTTRHIARTADLSEATLYKHFRDKDELFVTVMREQVPADFTGYLAGLAAHAGAETVSATLFEVATRAIEFYRKTTPMLGSVFAVPDLLIRHQQELRDTGLGPHLALSALAEYLTAEQRAHRLPADARPETMAALLLGACFQRAFLDQFLGRKTTSRSDAEFARQMVATLLAPDESATCHP